MNEQVTNYGSAQTKFRIEPVQNAVLNIKGWRIVRSDGAVMLPFVQKREAEKLIEFFTELQ